MNVYDNDNHDLFVEDVPVLTATDIDRIIEKQNISFGNEEIRQAFVADVVEKTIDDLNHTGVLEAYLSGINEIAYAVTTNAIMRAAKRLQARCVGYFFERPGFQGLDANNITTCVEHIDASSLGIHPMTVEATEVESTAIGFVDASVVRDDNLICEIRRTLITVMNDMDAESEDGRYQLVTANAYIMLDR